MKKIFVLIFLISIILTLSLIGFQNLENQKIEGKATLIILTIGNTTSEEVIVGNESVLQLLLKNHGVATQRTGSTLRLNCIDEVCAKNGFWWKFFVNNKIILNSVDRYYPKKGDIIKLEYGEI